MFCMILIVRSNYYIYFFIYFYNIIHPVMEMQYFLR